MRAVKVHGRTKTRKNIDVLYATLENDEGFSLEFVAWGENVAKVQVMRKSNVIFLILPPTFFKQFLHE
jgi:hypothetical protein